MTMIQQTRHRCEFRVMGSAAEIEVVDGSDDHLSRARRRLHFLEQRWSRFINSSDVSRLNAAGGAPVEVDASTITLLEAMVHAHHATGGAFDPTVLPAVMRLGYAASRHKRTMHVELRPGVTDAGDLTSIQVVRGAEDDAGRPLGTSIATLPAGTAIDAGGIGKGLAADLVAHELLRAGAAGAMVSIGGDLRVAGCGPNDGDWVIAIYADRAGGATSSRSSEMPPARDIVDYVRLADGGVATSGTIHHQVDPSSNERAAAQRDGAPLAQASIVGGSAMWAEVCATWAMVRGLDVIDHLERLSLGARLQFGDGAVAATPSWFRYSLSASGHSGNGDGNPITGTPGITGTGGAP
ncbi:MAG: FAD:protein FMN transferase [Ilumatobacteraceae bacterium]